MSKAAQYQQDENGKFTHNCSIKTDKKHCHKVCSTVSKEDCEVRYGHAMKE